MVRGRKAGVLGGAQDASATEKKYEQVAATTSHGEEANGIHDYPWDARLLKTALERSNKDELLDLIAYLECTGISEHGAGNDIGHCCG